MTTATTMAATTMTTTLCKGRRRRRENHDACEGCGCSLAEIVFVVDPKDGADGGTRWRRRLGKVRWCPMRQHEREHVECRNSEHVVKEEELSMLQGCQRIVVRGMEKASGYRGLLKSELKAHDSASRAGNDPVKLPLGEALVGQHRSIKLIAEAGSA